MTIQATPVAAPTQTVDPKAAPDAPVAAPTTPPAVDKKPDEISSKFAALARKEKMLRDEQGRFKASRAEWAEREKRIAQQEAEWEKEFKENPLQFLKKKGISYEDLTKAALNDGKFDPSVEVKEVKSELQKLREEQAEKERRAAEEFKKQQEDAENQAVQQFKERITEHVGANKDKYELVSMFDATELVFQTVEEHFARTSKEGKPKILSVDEAAQMVETYLEGEIERVASGSKKFQSKYASAKPKEEQKPAKPTTTTLTNQMTTSSAPSLLPASTENDRIKRALAALG